LTGVEIAEQAVGLQILDMLIDLRERYLFVSNTAPRCIPSISDSSRWLGQLKFSNRRLFPQPFTVGHNAVAKLLKNLVAAVGLEPSMLLKTRQIIDFITWFCCACCA
jgi:hypothetical protein